MGEIQMPREVSETLEEIRRSGETNMWDFNAVQALAADREEYRTALWLENHREEYAEVLTTWDRSELG